MFWCVKEESSNEWLNCMGLSLSEINKANLLICIFEISCMECA